MTSLEIRAELSEKLQHLATTQNQSIDDVVESLLRTVEKSVPPLLEQTAFSTATLETVLNSAWQLFMVIDSDGYIIKANDVAKDVAQSILGRRMEIGNSVYDFVFDGDEESFKSRFQKVLAGETLVLEKDFPASDRVYRLMVRYAPIIAPSGDVLGMCISGENKMLEIALRGIEEQFRQIGDHLPLAFFLTDLQKKQTIYISPAYEDITGLPLEHFYENPRSFLDIVHPEDRASVMSAMKEQMLGKSVEREYRILHSDKGLRWIKSQAIPVPNEAGDVYRIAGIAQDITRLKETEIALRESEARYAEAEKLGHFGHWENNFASDTSYWSPGMYRILGLDPEDKVLNVEEFLKFIHPDDSAQFKGRAQDFLTTTSEFTGEYRIIRPDGEERVVHAIGHVNGDSLGHPVQLIGSLIDITEFRQIESQLKLYEVVVEAASDLILAMNLNYTYILVNQTYLEYHQMKREDIIGKHVGELLGEEFFIHVIKPQFLRCLSGEVQSFETEFDYRTKGKRYLLVTYSPMHDSSRTITGIVTIIRDITERKQAQIALQASEKKLDTLFKVLPVGVSLLDNNNQIVQMNPALENILDLTLPDLIRGMYNSRRYLQSDGNPMLPDQFPSARAITEQRAIFDVEIGIVKEDESLVWTSVSAAPLPIPDMSAVVVTADITERKQNEANRIALELEQKRAAILQDFVTYAGHEFRTPLAIMRTNIFLAKKAIEDAKRNQKLEAIDEQIDVVLQLVENLVLITRLESNVEYVTSPCDINFILRDQVLTAKTYQNLDVKIQLRLDNAMPAIEGNVDDLIRVFIEIINNAIQFTPDRGTISIQTVIQDQQVCVTIQDTGIGMSQDVLRRIFERFYRLDKVHTTRGLGLGLPIAKKIIELHHGTIHVQSTVGKGTEVTIILPLVRH